MLEHQPQKRRLVRKLQLRWWHCGATTLHRLLKAAAAPADVLDMVPEIVDTCRICRAWSRPTNSIASSRLVTAFNKEVEGDIVFVKFQGNNKSFLHLVDRASRWCAFKSEVSRREQLYSNTSVLLTGVCKSSELTNVHGTGSGASLSSFMGSAGPSSGMRADARPNTATYGDTPPMLDMVFTGEDRAEGASFWYAFLTPFWGPKNIFFFSKETMLKPMSGLSQIQDKPSKRLD